MSVELWKLFCILRTGRGGEKKKKKTVFIKSGAANINMTFDISALKRRRWAASYALLSNPLSDNSSSQNTAGFSATCSIQPGSLTSTIVPNEKQWIRQACKFCFIYLFSVIEHLLLMTDVQFSNKHKVGMQYKPSLVNTLSFTMSDFD